MKKGALLIVLLLLAVPVILASQEIIHSESIKVKTTISSSLTFIPKKEPFKVESAEVKLFLIPREDARSKVLQFQLVPEGENRGEYINFFWKNPTAVDFSVEAVTETRGDVVPITKRIPFPLQGIPEEIKKYLEAGDIIDAKNPEIVQKANELAAGDDDAFRVAYKVGAWIQDYVNYSLDTLTADASQKASWVMQNKRGVCDEITSLFIAMMRALGIPAKFVSGVAYTDWKNLNDFGPHAWAEAYFPGVGWVPFDLTYGEYGFVDAPHIKLKEDVDANDVSTKYEWKGINVDAQATELDIKNEILEVGKRAKPLVEIKAEAFKKSVGFRSYNLIQAVVNNPNSFYVITDVSVSQNDHISVVDKTRKVVLLQPNEKKRVYWTLKLQGDLTEGYVYTIPVMVYTTRNASSTVAFEAQSSNPEYTLNEIESYRRKHEQEEKQVLVTGLTLSCQATPDTVQQGQEVTIRCTVKNEGTIPTTTKACLENNCKDVSLGLAQEQQISFAAPANTVGENTLTVMAGSEQSDATFVVYDKPSVAIENLQHPKQASYDERFTISFTLKKKSFSDVKDVSVQIADKRFTIDNLADSVPIEAEMRGSDVTGNTIRITLTFSDQAGKKVQENKDIELQLINLTFFQKIKMFFKRFF